MITIRLSIQAEERVKLWELHGVSTPVRYCTINFAPVEQNYLQVGCHEDVIKVLRLKKLKFWKQAWKLTRICGYYTEHKEFMKIVLPPSWKGMKLISIPINNFLRYLLDETWQDF